MPLIEDISRKAPKKFEKRIMRPWDDNLAEIVVEPMVRIDKANEELTGQEKIVSLSEKFQLKTNNLEHTEHKSTNTEVKIASNNKTSGILMPVDIERFTRGVFGVQRSLLVELISSINSEDSDFAYTMPIYYSDLVNKLKVKQGSIGTSLHRLKVSGVLILDEHKTGRGGYSTYKIPKYIYDYLKGHFKANPRG